MTFSQKHESLHLLLNFSGDLLLPLWLREVNALLQYLAHVLYEAVLDQEGFILLVLVLALLPPVAHRVYLDKTGQGTVFGSGFVGSAEVFVLVEQRLIDPNLPIDLHLKKLNQLYGVPPEAVDVQAGQYPPDPQMVVLLGYQGLAVALLVVLGPGQGARVVVVHLHPIEAQHHLVRVDEILDYLLVSPEDLGFFELQFFARFVESRLEVIREEPLDVVVLPLQPVKITGAHVGLEPSVAFVELYVVQGLARLHPGPQDVLVEVLGASLGLA